MRILDKKSFIFFGQHTFSFRFRPGEHDIYRKWRAYKCAAAYTNGNCTFYLSLVRITRLIFDAAVVHDVLQALFHVATAVTAGRAEFGSTVHQVLLAQRHQFTGLLKHLAFYGSGLRQSHNDFTKQQPRQQFTRTVTERQNTVICIVHLCPKA